MIIFERNLGAGCAQVGRKAAQARKAIWAGRARKTPRANASTNSIEVDVFKLPGTTASRFAGSLAVVCEDREKKTDR